MTVAGQSPSATTEMCGGCGNADPAKRCIGCLHDFAPASLMGKEKKRWQDIAADMIEAKGFSISGLSDDVTIAAAAFVFDEGIMFLPERSRAEVVQMLRAKPESTQ